MFPDFMATLYMEANVRLHAQTALPPRNEPRYPLEWRLRVPRSRSGLCGEERKVPCGEVNPVHRPAPVT
jgi:hypothetical protein